MKYNRMIFVILSAALILTALLGVTASAAGDVAGAVEDTWDAAKGQIKDVTNRVIFPVIDLILAILLFVKIATSYLEYRKHGQFDWVPIAILFACLVFSLTCPMYLWNIIGM